LDRSDKETVSFRQNQNDATKLKNETSALKKLKALQFFPEQVV
jgi:hypothetical protein